MTDNPDNSQSPEKDLIEILRDDISSEIENIISFHIAVWRRNAENVMVTIPVDKLKQFLGEDAHGDIKFYIDKNWVKRIKEEKEKQNQDDDKDSDLMGDQVSIDDVKEHGRIKDQVERFKMMSIPEREEILDDSIEKLSGVIEKGIKLDLAAVIKMVEVLANTLYANHANLEDNISPENLKGNLLGVYVKTEWIIKLIIEFFMREGHSYDDVAIINDIKTDSYTFDHIIRVFLMFVNFCIFINEYIDKGLVSKNIRGEFIERYQRYYKKRLEVSDISLEIIIKGGIRRIDAEKELQKYVIGSLLYDLGKFQDVVYQDGTEEYDENRVKVHVLNSYNMIMKAKGYPFVVSAMAAFHHEYYGGIKSYNFTAPILSKLTGKKSDDSGARYFITFDENEFKNRVALAFFPNKIIEILDIYDAITTRKNNPPADALKIMKKDCIAKSLMIDPLLFELFIDFIIECGFIQAGIREELDKIMY